MTKLIQEKINGYTLNEFKSFNNEISKKKIFDYARLRNCQAYVDETANYFFVKSYNTIVAFINKNTGEKFDVLRYVFGYTATSAQHIAKFFRDFSDTGIVGTYTYRDV